MTVYIVAVCRIEDDSLLYTHSCWFHKQQALIEAEAYDHNEISDTYAEVRCYTVNGDYSIVEM